MILQTAPASTLVERARRAEDAGFGAVYVADHYVSPVSPQADWLDAWVVLAAFAGATTAVRLGPLVSAPAFRNPAVLARQAVTLDHLTGGRLELGVGAGGAPLDETMTGGGPLPGPARFERFREWLEIVDILLRDGAITTSGAYYAVEAARLAPRPVQQPRPPIVVGALGRKAIALAAARADAFSSYPLAAGARISAGEILSGDEARTLWRQRNAVADAACDQLGRRRDSLRRSYLSMIGLREPVPTPDAFRRFADAYAPDELVVYWPKDSDDESRFLALARAC